MARTPLRPDIAAAQSSAKFSLGSRREFKLLARMLSADEAVTAMAQCRYQGCFGLAVLTDTRFLFLSDGVIWKASEEIGLDRIVHVHWRTVFRVGSLTLHAGGAPLELTGFHGPGGPEILRGIRRHVAGKDRLDRQTRDGILAMAARFAPAPGPMPEPEPTLDVFPDELSGAYFLSDSELLPQA